MRKSPEIMYPLSFFGEYDLPPNPTRAQITVRKREKNDRPESSSSHKRRELKKNQAVVVMVIGIILFAQAFFFSTETGSSAHSRLVVALIGSSFFSRDHACAR